MTGLFLQIIGNLEEKNLRVSVHLAKGIKNVSVTVFSISAKFLSQTYTHT